MMQKSRKKIFTIKLCALLALVLLCPNMSKAEDGAIGGTNRSGDFVISPTISMRCGLTTENSNIEDDCIKRLAYDYITNASHLEMFNDYSEEKNIIIDEYQSAFLEMALGKLVETSKQEDELNKTTCVDITAPGCATIGKDILTVIRYTNNIAVDNTKTLVGINLLKGSDAIINSIEYILSNVVSSIEVDASDTSLAGPPN